MFSRRESLIIFTTVILTLVVIILIAGFAWFLFIDYNRKKIINEFNVDLKKYCEDLPVPSFQYDSIPIPEEGIYTLETANPLRELSFVTSTYNCDNYEIKIPNEFTNYQVLKNSKGVITGIVYLGDDIITIVFSGTLLLSQWSTDFDYIQVAPEKLHSYQEGELVHKGFYNAYIEFQEKILEILNSYNNQFDLIVTGHSLGGSLSTLCASDLFSRNLLTRTKTHYSFASPRVGNKIFVENYNRKVFGLRINNTEDIIPQFPLVEMSEWKYDHVGKNIPFTFNLESISKNHVEAYEHLPSCPLPVGKCE